MNSELILRKLIIGEVALSLVLLSIGLFGEPFLPASLHAYLQTQSDAPMTLRDWILLPVDLLVLVLLVVAWVGLWRGWRSSRRLYTLLWVLTIPLLLVHGPDIASGVSRFFETFTTLVGGLIMGLLYFSDLRQRYENPTVA